MRPALSEIGIQYTHVERDLYRLGGQEFAVAPWQGDNARGRPWDRYVTMFLSAGSFAAVRGLVLGDPGSEEIPRHDPPEDLLLKRGCVTFEDVIGHVKSAEPGSSFMAKIAPRASLFESVFVVAVARFDYFFSSGVEDWSGTLPVMIAWNTSDDRWTRLGSQAEISALCTPSV